MRLAKLEVGCSLYSVVHTICPRHTGGILTCTRHQVVVLVQEGRGEACTKAALAFLLVHVAASARDEGLVGGGLLRKDVGHVVRLGWEAGSPGATQCLGGVMRG